MGQFIFGLSETSLHNGPVYFNCYPNFALSLSDRNVMDDLTLNVKTDGYYMKDGSEPLAIIYRIYYKLMKTTIDPQSCRKYAYKQRKVKRIYFIHNL